MLTTLINQAIREEQIANNLVALSLNYVEHGNQERGEFLANLSFQRRQAAEGMLDSAILAEEVLLEANQAEFDAAVQDAKFAHEDRYGPMDDIGNRADESWYERQLEDWRGSDAFLEA